MQDIIIVNIAVHVISCIAIMDNTLSGFQGDRVHSQYG